MKRLSLYLTLLIPFFGAAALNAANPNIVYIMVDELGYYEPAREGAFSPTDRHNRDRGAKSRKKEEGNASKGKGTR